MQWLLRYPFQNTSCPVSKMLPDTEHFHSPIPQHGHTTYKLLQYLFLFQCRNNNNALIQKTPVSADDLRGCLPKQKIAAIESRGACVLPRGSPLSEFPQDIHPISQPHYHRAVLWHVPSTESPDLFLLRHQNHRNNESPLSSVPRRTPVPQTL